MWQLALRVTIGEWDGMVPVEASLRIKMFMSYEYGLDVTIRKDGGCCMAIGVAIWFRLRLREGLGWSCLARVSGLPCCTSLRG